MSNIKSLNTYIDHTILKANATKGQVQEICKEAMEYSFASVCVNSCWTALCSEQLKNSTVKVCSVVGFPLGAMKSESKAFEAKSCVIDGAEEVDMVINVGMLLNNDLEGFEKDIRLVREACGPGVVLKVIIETCLLNDEQKVIACRIAKNCGADFVKTSTGFSTGGATVEDILLMRKTVGEFVGVKASGGVRSYEDAVTVIEAGANRIGASSGVSIMKGQVSESDY